RTDIDDRAGLLFDHRGKNSLGAELGAEERDFVAAFPLFGGRFGRVVPLFRDIGSVVAEDIDTAVFLQTGRCKPGDRFCGSVVAGYEGGIASGSAYFFFDFFAPSGVNIGDDDERPFARESFGDAATDAVRSSGDDGGFIFKSHRWFTSG